MQDKNIVSSRVSISKSSLCMNEVENDDIEIVINLNEDNHDDVLNVPISQTEIENVILNLHNDKSSGLDNVTNEYNS
jgi:hypothetical protein